jgi:hypothetical protein
MGFIKMFKTLLYFIVVLSCSRSLASVRLSDELKKCFAMKDGKATKRQACFADLGFKTPSCQFTEKAISCNAKDIRKVFPQIEGFAIVDVWLDGEHGVEGQALGTAVGSKARYFEGFEIGADVFPFYFVSKQRGKSWSVAKPSFSFTLDKIIEPGQAAITEFSAPDSPPWKRVEASACDEPPLRIRPSRPKEDRSKILKAMDYDEAIGAFPQRQFVGRKGPSDFPIVQSFTLKKPLRICGVSIPEGTKLGISDFDPSDCDTAVDGTPKIDGIPRELFPAGRFKKIGDGPDVMTCGPGGRSSAHFEQLAKLYEPGKKISLPKLDWQNCECHHPDPVN